MSAAASVGQGQSLVVWLAAGAGAAPKATFAVRTVVMARAGSRWLAVFPVPLEMRPGSQTVTVTYRGEGRLARVSRSCRVRAVAYPHQQIRMRAQVARLYDRSVSGEERRIVNRAIHGVEPAPLWRGQFAVPTSGRYSTAFGTRRVRNGRVSYRHKGIDISAPEGRAIVASNDGVVRVAGRFHLFGNCVVIDHGAAVTTLYLHMSALEVSEGERVRRGALIGRVGDTGAATGPHLHWSLYVHGVAVDPVQWTIDPALAVTVDAGRGEGSTSSPRTRSSGRR
jgi:murein DD-endopeptidase MepM/ murein hydrolase activator NlpD